MSLQVTYVLMGWTSPNWRGVNSILKQWRQRDEKIVVICRYRRSDVCCCHGLDGARSSPVAGADRPSGHEKHKRRATDSPPAPSPWSSPLPPLPLWLRLWSAVPLFWPWSSWSSWIRARWFWTRRASRPPLSIDHLDSAAVNDALRQRHSGPWPFWNHCRCLLPRERSTRRTARNPWPMPKSCSASSGSTRSDNRAISLSPQIAHEESGTGASLCRFFCAERQVGRIPIAAPLPGGGAEQLCRRLPAATRPLAIWTGPRPRCTQPQSCRRRGASALPLTRRPHSRAPSPLRGLGRAGGIPSVLGWHPFNCCGTIAKLARAARV